MLTIQSAPKNPTKILARNFKINQIHQKCYKSHLVIMGAGWGGFRLASDIDKEKYDVTVLSPRNHFLFTPLLPSTSVGTLEFRCVQEPVRYFDLYFIFFEILIQIFSFTNFFLNLFFNIIL